VRESKRLPTGSSSTITFRGTRPEPTSSGTTRPERSSEKHWVSYVERLGKFTVPGYAKSDEKLDEIFVTVTAISILQCFESGFDRIRTFFVVPVSEF
jgi:hypothetical protein